MKRLLILIGFIGIATITQAQKAKLTGKITSSKNEALASVSLSLQSDKTQVSKTDIEGRYSFTIDVAKNYTLVLTYVGYKNKTVQDIKATTANEDLVVDVVLEEANSKLADVTVSANRAIIIMTAQRVILALITHQIIQVITNQVDITTQIAVITIAVLETATITEEIVGGIETEIVIVTVVSVKSVRLLSAQIRVVIST